MTSDGEQCLLRASFDGKIDADDAAGSNKAQAAGEVSFVDGISGKAALVGQNTSISFQISHNLNPSEGTLSFWMKPVGWSGGDNQYHYFVTLNGESDWIMLQTASKSLAFLGGTKASYNLNAVPIADWQDGVWRHVVVTWKDGRNRMYLDGRPAGPTSSWLVVPSKVGSEIRIGGQMFGTSTGQTAIDELRIYANALTEKDVAQLYERAIHDSPQLLAQHNFLKSQEIADGRNIAKPEFGAIVIPSSQSESADFHVENIADGNFDTRWISSEGSFPNWVEVRWPQPVTADTLIINEAPLSRTAEYRIDARVDGAWRTIVGPKSNTRNAGERIVDSFAPIQTTKIRYYMLKPDGDGLRAVSSITELQVCGTADGIATNKEVSRPSWKSNWIWYPEGEVDDVVRYFRRHFQVDHPDQVKNAFLQIAADDTYEVYVNETFVGNGSIPTTVYDVTKLLQAGDNLIAVKCHEYSIFEGLIAELTLNHGDGSVERIVTDRLWKSFNADVPNWFAFVVDDKAWKPCKELGIPPFCIDHASQQYFDRSFKEKFGLKSVRVTPSVVKPGEKVEIHLELAVPATVHSDYGFILRIGEKRVALGSDYDVATKSVLPPTNTSQWRAGETHSLSVTLSIPDWAPHGATPIYLTPVGKGIEGMIDGVSDAIGSVNIRRFKTDPKPWPAKLPRAEVKFDNGHPTLLVNGKILPPFIMTEQFYPNYESLGEHAKTGVHVWRVFAQKGIVSRFNEANRNAENEEFFAAIDQQIECLLKVDPEAFIIVGTGVDVSQAWTDAHPDDATLLSDGRRIQHSLSSRRWIEESKNDIRALVKHLADQKYAGRIIGLHTAIGGETYYWGLNANRWDTPRDSIIAGDYSPEHIRAFRDWLREKYRNDVRALRNAWNDKAVDFESAKPDPAILRREDLLVFRDPAKTRMPMDYWEFHSDVMARRVIDICRTVKEASGGRLLTGFWGLYSDGFNTAAAAPGRLHHCAFAGLQKVLESPYVDYIAALHAYANVRWGTPAVPINLTESIRRHGKMLLVEYDTRTFHTPLRFTMRTYSQQETLSILRRNVATSVVRGDALWWVGFREGSTGRVSVPWFAEDSLVRELTQLRRLYDAAYRCDLGSVAEIAVFMNNADIYGLDMVLAPKLLGSLQYNSHIQELQRLGAPFDLYHLDDIALPGMDRYKVYVFCNAFTLTMEQRNRIEKVVRQKGKTAVWVYAPGFSDGTKLSTALIKELTGFNVGYDAETIAPEVRVQDGLALTKFIEPGYRVKPVPYQYAPGKFEIGPIFHIDDKDAQILGGYVHNGKAAIGAKTIDGATSIYVAVPSLDSKLLRSICRGAGVHFYCDRDVYMDVSKHFIEITTGENGYRGTLLLPGSFTVADAFTGKEVAKNQSDVEITVPPLTTALFYYGSEKDVAAFLAALGIPRHGDH